MTGRFLKLIAIKAFTMSTIYAQVVNINVNAEKPIGEMKPFWAFFGYDEPNYTTRENGKNC